TICTKVDQPSVSMPRKPLRNAARALPFSLLGSTLANTKAPETAHSPGCAACSNTNVSEESRRMVRRAFMGATYCCRRRARLGKPALPAVSDARAHFYRAIAAEDRHSDRKSVV